MLLRIPIVPNPAYIYVVSLVVCGGLRRLPKCRKYAEFGTVCIHVPVKSIPCLFCVMCNVLGRDCKYYYLVFRSVPTLQ